MSSMNGYKSNYGPAGGTQRPSNISGYDLATIPTMSPETADLYKYLIGNTKQGAGDSLNSLSGFAKGEGFDALEAPINRQFQKNVGQIASQFSGFGMGGRDSSAFNSAVAGEAAQSAERLGANRINLQMKAISELLAMSKSLLSTDYQENMLVKKPQESNWWHSLIAGGLPIAGAAAGGLIGGPAGAAIGGGVGKSAGQAFM